MNKRRVARRIVGGVLMICGLCLGFGLNGVVLSMIGGIMLCEN